MGAPKVTVDDFTILLGSSIDAPSLITVTDPDGDPIDKVRFYDTSGSGGYFTYNGVVQAANTWIEINYANLHLLSYNGGAGIGDEQIRFEAVAAGQTSDVAEAVAYSVTLNTTPPDVFVSDLTVVQNEMLNMADWVSAYDTNNGWPIDLYKFRNRNVGVNSGTFYYKGVEQGRNSWFYVKAAELDQVIFYAAHSAPNNNRIDVRARDGHPVNDGGKWSSRETFNIGTVLNANRPSVTPFEYVTAINEKIAMRDLFTWADADDNTAKRFRFWDTSAHHWTGYMQINGVVQPSKQWVEIVADDLGKMEWVSASRFHQEQIRVQVYDGKHWSGIQTVRVRTDEKPVLQAIDDTHVWNELEEILVSDLYTKVDSGPVITKWQVYDSNDAGFTSGKFRRGLTDYDAAEVHEFTAQEFTSLVFKGGVFDVRSLDEIYVRAYNGQVWGDWVRLNARTEPHYIEALNVTSWKPFLPPTDPLVITYSFMEEEPAYGGGGNVFVSPWGNLRDAFRFMFESVEDYINVDYQEVPDTLIDPSNGHRGGRIRVGTYCDYGDGAAAYAFFPGPNEINGDIWLNRASYGGPESNPEIPGPPPIPECTVPPRGGNFGTPETWGPGTIYYEISLHELGHAMGMKHSFDPSPIISPEAESSQFTLMSYTDYNPENGRSYMLYDLASLQATYGEAENNPGDTVYDLAYFEDDFNRQLAIWDTGGRDVIDVSHSLFDNIITLREGEFLSVDGSIDNIAIAFNAVLEDVIGGIGADTITGNESENSLMGGVGNDIIQGYGGNDYLSGGQNDDVFIINQGDGHDVVNEDRAAGRDRIELGLFIGMDDFATDMSFSKIKTDLTIDFRIDDGLSRGSVTIRNQDWGGSRIETLEFLGQDVDLHYLNSIISGVDQRFTISNQMGQFGYLVTAIS